MAIIKLDDDPFKDRKRRERDSDIPKPTIDWRNPEEQPKTPLGLSETDPLTCKSINDASGAE